MKVKTCTNILFIHRSQTRDVARPSCRERLRFQPKKRVLKISSLFRQHSSHIKGAEPHQETIVIEKVVPVRRAGFFPWVKIDDDGPNRTTGSEKSDCVF